MYNEPPPESVAVQRTPPQDFAAEQGVLGAMLMSKDAIAEVLRWSSRPISTGRPMS